MLSRTSKPFFYRRSADGGLTSPLTLENRALVQQSIVNHFPRLHRGKSPNTHTCTEGQDRQRVPVFPRGPRSLQEGWKEGGEPLGSLLHHNLLIRRWLKERTAFAFAFLSVGTVPERCHSCWLVRLDLLLNFKTKSKAKNRS